MKLNILFLTFGVLSVSSSNLDQEQHIKTHNPYTVNFNSHLITFSHYRTNNSTHHIVTHSTDPNITLCRIALDANKDQITGVIRGIALKNRIVIWSERNVNFAESTRADFTVLLIDPLQCTYKSIPNIIDEVPSSYPTYRPILLAHDDDSFDIFFASQHTCSPCRFNEEGKKFDLQHHLQAESEKPGFFNKIEYLMSTRRYAYVYNFPNRTAKVKLLDEAFSVYQQIWIDEVVSELTVSLGAKKSYIGITYSPPMSEQTDYLLFDSDLFLIFRVTLPLLDFHSPQHAILSIDSSGESLISFVQSSRINGDIAITSLKYDLQGKLVVGNTTTGQIKRRGPNDVQALLLDKREYCVVIHKGYDDNDTELRITKIKCNDVSQ